MNKKFLAFGVLGLFAFALVTAAVVEYYGSVQQDISIELPIEITGNEPQPIGEYAGATFSGEDIVITNDADFPVTTTITNDAPEGVDVEYKGTLTLSKKVVDFGNEPWDLADGEVEVEYVVVGDNFDAEVTSPIEGYELFYYKDNSDRFNNPATAISVNDVEGNLPYTEDGNADEYDMCEIEGYTNCHGAKIWYIPSDAVTSGEIDWSRADEFYFETNLIQYNTESIVVFSDLTIEPVYTVDPLFEGDATITTEIA